MIYNSDMSSLSLPQIRSVSARERGINEGYEYMNGIVDYDKTVHRLGRLGSNGLMMLGEIHLQEAANDPDKANVCLDRAEEVFSERVFTEGLGFDPRAALRLAQMSLYRSLFGDECMPDLHMLEDSYQGVMAAAVTAANHYTFDDDKTTVEHADLMGTVSEATGLLLVERHSLISDIPAYWLPVQSLYTEAIRPNGWKISIYTPDLDNNEKPRIAYRLKVNSNRRHASRYDRKIADVAINPDLAIESEDPASTFRILSELQNESDPDKSSRSASKRLNLRTEKLLKALDRTE